MAGIVGITGKGNRNQVIRMLERITHRGEAGTKVIENTGAILGAVWPKAQAVPTPPTLQEQAVWDARRPPLPNPAALEQEAEPFALAAVTPEGLVLARDPLGVRPLYYGQIGKETLCFASEVKALLEVTQVVHEFPPGCWYGGPGKWKSFFEIKSRPGLGQENADQLALGLRLRLEQAVCRRLDSEVMGCWLSGGLDSSAMAALARPHVRHLHTFAAGLAGAPDLEFARQVADYLDTEHHQVVVTQEQLVAALPEVIYHLESFDALLVRSSITNYLLSQHVADHVGSLFSGEGADELFAGYAYLKQVEPGALPSELLDITRRLHNTALQRVDRSASAHGLVAHVPFLDPEVVRYAIHIPARFKLRRNGAVVEKWILRRAVEDVLPETVVWRHKAKFWQGAGVGDLLAMYAEEQISDDEFKRERILPNSQLNSKEELLYYRIFSQHFGELENLAWMGRTKGAPRS